MALMTLHGTHQIPRSAHGFRHPKELGCHYGQSIIKTICIRWTFYCTFRCEKTIRVTVVRWFRIARDDSRDFVHILGTQSNDRRWHVWCYEQCADKRWWCLWVIIMINVAAERRITLSSEQWCVFNWIVKSNTLMVGLMFRNGELLYHRCCNWIRA